MVETPPITRRQYEFIREVAGPGYFFYNPHFKADVQTDLSAKEFQDLSKRGCFIISPEQSNSEDEVVLFRYVLSKIGRNLETAEVID